MRDGPDHSHSVSTDQSGPRPVFRSRAGVLRPLDPGFGHCIGHCIGQRIPMDSETGTPHEFGANLFHGSQRLGGHDFTKQWMVPRPDLLGSTRFRHAYLSD